MAAALTLILLLALTACGAQSEQQAGKGDGPTETLKGIYEALLAPDSSYSRNKAMYKEYYPEVEYGEELEADRITLSFKANGNEYASDGSWDFIQDGDRLNAVVQSDDYAGIFNMLNIAEAIGTYFGMEPELVRGYLNGLGALGIESDNLIITENAVDGTTGYSLNIAGPWDMKELDQMLLNETLLGSDPSGNDYTSQGGSVGKLLYMITRNSNCFTALLSEFGELDDVAYQSIVNLISLRKPAGWEGFLADFTELKALETDEYIVDLDPDDATIAEIMGERSEKRSYVLVRFGSDEYGEQEIEISVPDAGAFADYFFRPVAEIPHGTAGSSLAEASAACDVLSFAFDNELWLADTDSLQANLQEAWDSLTDAERAGFCESFPALDELLNNCFADPASDRGRFEDAGVAELMDELLAEGTAQWSWEALSNIVRALAGID